MVSAWLVCGSAFAAAEVTSAAPVKPVTVLLDDVTMTFEGTSAQIASNVTFVPFRAIAEAMGIDVGWNASTKSITATNQVNGQPKTVILQVGKTIAKVNGKSVKLAAPPFMKDGRTLIPLNFFSTQFGAQVGWNAASKTVTIVSPTREMHLRGFYAIKSYGELSRINDMNSVAFGWMRVNENGEIITDGADFRWPIPDGDTTGESIVQSAASSAIDPYLMVYAGDSKGELTKLLSDENLRSRSIDQISSTAKEKGFTGVMLDYEDLGLHDAAGDRKLLNEYVRLLHDQLAPAGIRLSLAVPPPNSYYQGYDFRTLASFADDLTIMAYGYQPQGTAEHTPQPNTRVEAALSALIKSGIPADKLLLGIDMWSETPQTIDDKLGLAKRYHLKGAAFWRLGLFYFYGQEMTDAINRSAVKTK